MGFKFNNVDGSVAFDEVTAPATPPTGSVRLYAKADGFLYSKDDVGTETQLGGGGGGGSEPANQIVYGTGGSIDSDADFTYVNTNGAFYVNTTNGTSGSVSTATPGNVGIFGADNSDGTAGAVRIYGGYGTQGVNTGQGGTVFIEGGGGGGGPTTIGGNVEITGGSAAATGGSVIIESGPSTSGTIPGNIYLTAAGSTTVGGQVSIAGGAGATAGGGITIDGGAPSSSGNGGGVTIRGGNGTTSGTGGDVSIAAGIKAGSNAPGRVRTYLSEGGFARLDAGTYSSPGRGEDKYVLYRTTTNATPTELFRDGAGASLRVTLAANTSYYFTVKIVGTTSTGSTAAYKFEGAIDRLGANTTALVGTPIKTTLAEDDTAWDADVTANSTDDALQVTVTGALATSINWTAVVEMIGG